MGDPRYRPPPRGSHGLALDQRGNGLRMLVLLLLVILVVLLLGGGGYYRGRRRL